MRCDCRHTAHACTPPPSCQWIPAHPPTETQQLTAPINTHSAFKKHTQCVRGLELVTCVRHTHKHTYPAEAWRQQSVNTVTATALLERRYTYNTDTLLVQQGLRRLAVLLHDAKQRDLRQALGPHEGARRCPDNRMNTEAPRQIPLLLYPGSIHCEPTHVYCCRIISLHGGRLE